MKVRSCMFSWHEDSDIISQLATRDINALRASLRTLLSHLYAHMSVEGQGLLYDFASFARLTLADGAEVGHQQTATEILANYIFQVGRASCCFRQGDSA
jgi:hypothetical protein